MIIFVEIGFADQDITNESVCFLSFVGNVVNFKSTRIDKPSITFVSPCTVVSTPFTHTRCGVLFPFVHRFTRTSNKME